MVEKEDNERLEKIGNKEKRNNEKQKKKTMKAGTYNGRNVMYMAITMR